MQVFGSDRVRVAGERIVLLSAIPKGWTARTQPTGTHSEFPGTAVYWEDQYFEVVEAAAQPNGTVRYVLLPWSDHHTIRTFEAYDAPSETARHEDHQRARRQRTTSALSRWSGMVLGFLPYPVQSHLQNTMGVNPSAMTVLSCIPVMVFVGWAVFWSLSGAAPLWIPLVNGLLVVETAVRFRVAMTQPRGMGSLLGTLLYILFWAVAPKFAPVSPFQAKGEATEFILPPSEEVSRRDALELREPFLTLLPAGLQRELAQLCGYDYRRKARAVALTILFFAMLGVLALDEEGRSVSPPGSLALATYLAVEQLVRLLLLRSRPVPSVLGLLFLPLVRGLRQP
jgi:hypothetical protein